MKTGDTFLFLSAFLASGVEFVEALTIVLAAGVSRGWRSSLAGLGAATPQSAERQPRASPAASTIVSASTISTALARNVERTSSAALMPTPRRVHPDDGATPARPVPGVSGRGPL